MFEISQRNMQLLPSWLEAIWSIGLCGVLLAIVGCGTPPPAIPQSTTDNLYTLYEAFDKASTTLKRGPKDLDELKKFLPPDKNVDELLISPHDGQPYVLVWGISTRQLYASELPPLLVYEKIGKDGKYNVLTTMSTQQITEEELKAFLAATPGAGKK